MPTITLRGDALIVHGDAADESMRPTSIDELERYFFCPVELANDYWLGDLMRLVDLPHAERLAAMSNENITPWLAEARPPARVAANDEIEFLRVCNVHEDVELRRDFDGWGPYPEPYNGFWVSTRPPLAAAASRSTSNVRRPSSAT